MTTTTTTTTVTFRKERTDRRTGVTTPAVTAEFDFTNPDLSTFYISDDLYNTEFKATKDRVETVFAAFKNWAKDQALLLGLPKWAAKGLKWPTLPTYPTGVSKNTCKNAIKKFVKDDHLRRDWDHDTKRSLFHAELTADQIETLTGIINKGLEQFAALNADWKANKSSLKKGSRKADEAKAAREANKIAHGYTSDPVVRGELDRLAAPAKAALVEQFLAHRANQLDSLRSLLDRYKIDLDLIAGNRNGSLAYTAYSYNDYMTEKNAAEEERMRKVNSRIRVLILDTMTPKDEDYDTLGYTVKTAEQNQAEAVQYADDVWETFLGKMEFKVCGLGISSIESTNFGSSDGWTSTMNCTARNGITFTLTNSIVTKCSYLGTWFNQFPARFGDVCRNGQHVKNAATLEAVRGLCGFKVEA